MEVGAFFILLVVFLVVTVLVGGVFLIARWLRSEQVDAESGGLPSADAKRRPRPEHTAVDTEQKTRFVGTQ